MGRKLASNGALVSDPSRYAPTSWGKTQSVSEPYEYETDSGQLCLIKNISINEILRLGLIDNLDFFTASLSEDEKKPDSEGESQTFAQKLLKNFDKMEGTINKVLLAGVIAPPLTPVPNGPASQRKEGLIYVDSIPFADRVELFGEILDSDGLSDFRKESQDDMGHVPAVQDVQLPAESTAGDTGGNSESVLSE